MNQEVQYYLLVINILWATYINVTSLTMRDPQRNDNASYTVNVYDALLHRTRFTRPVKARLRHSHNILKYLGKLWVSKTWQKLRGIAMTKTGAAFIIYKLYVYRHLQY